MCCGDASGYAGHPRIASQLYVCLTGIPELRLLIENVAPLGEVQIEIKLGHVHAFIVEHTSK